MDTSGLRKETGARKRKDGTTVTRYYKGFDLIAKDCSICHEIKSVNEYAKAPLHTARDGRYSRCIDCTKEEQKMYRDRYKNDTTRKPYKYKISRDSRTEADLVAQQQEMYPEGVKVCTTCGEAKNLSKFHKNRTTKDGLKYRCAKCENKARRVKGDPKEVQARRYPDGTKKCPKCEESKDLAQFYRNRTNSDGLHRNCRACDSTHYRNKRRQEYEDHWRDHNIPFECYICRGPYEQSDHVIPAKLGGVDHPDNRLPICSKHNSSKNSTPLRQWLHKNLPDSADEVVDRVTIQYNIVIDL